MRHEQWVDHLDPMDESTPLLHVHCVLQRHNGRTAFVKFVASDEMEADRRAKAFMLRGARRDLRAFIEEQGRGGG